MATDDQIQANQENAQLSTGPKTEEGKNISKMNALKHGILSKEILIEGEDEELLVDFGGKMKKELQPVGELELLLVDKIVVYTWRLRRVLTVEKAMMEWERIAYLKPVFDTNLGPTEQKERRASVNMLVNDETEKLTRYEASVVRNFYKALHELMRLQAARRGEKPPLPMAVDFEAGRD